MTYYRFIAGVLVYSFGSSISLEKKRYVAFDTGIYSARSVPVSDYSEKHLGRLEQLLSLSETMISDWGGDRPESSQL